MAIMEIRDAQKGDLPDLTAAMRQADYFADRLDRHEQRRGILLIAWLDNRPVGTVYLWLETAEEPELRRHLPGTPLVTHLQVRRGYRRNGIATALLEESHERLAALGHPQVALGVDLANRAAVRLYLKLGYRQWPYSAVETPADTFQVFVRPLARGGSPGRGRS
jgi:GNAT superfamily N-acetyltransferase